MPYVIKNCTEPFQTKIWDSQDQLTFLSGKVMRSIDIQLVRVGLVISVDRDGPHHVCTGHPPVTQVGYIIVLIDTD
jgi:hypothetical protein